MQAVGLLRELGYTSVSHYPGGLAEWFEHDSSRGAIGDAAPRTSAPRAFAPRTVASRTISMGFIDALADRSVGSLFRLWIEIVAVFAVVYWLLDRFTPPALLSGGGLLAADAGGFLSALYFSAVTATSVGYGDIVPTGPARALAITSDTGRWMTKGTANGSYTFPRQPAFWPMLSWLPRCRSTPSVT